MSSKIFSIERYKKIKHKFGTIVYVSNQDISCEEALNLYKQRWDIELLNDFYKNTLELETVRQHDDYSVYGDEFLNMLILIISNRIKNKFLDSKALEIETYCDVMKIFKQFKKIQMLSRNDIWYEIELPKKSLEFIKKILYS
nr:hypothetical protein [Metamycoplasma auris]